MYYVDICMTDVFGGYPIFKKNFILPADQIRNILAMRAYQKHKLKNLFYLFTYTGYKRC